MTNAEVPGTMPDTRRGREKSRPLYFERGRMNERKGFMDLTGDEIRSSEMNSAELTPNESRELDRVIRERIQTIMYLQLCER